MGEDYRDRRSRRDQDASGESTAWAESTRAGILYGPKCAQFERCFLTPMHQRAAESDIIIVNHHLFFADLAVRTRNSDGILPDYNAVIFDEAHEIEDVAGDYFGVGVSNYRFQELQRDIGALSRMRNFASKELDRILIRLEEIALAVLRRAREAKGKGPFYFRSEFLEYHGDVYRIFWRRSS